jgi:hypothetical protein
LGFQRSSPKHALKCVTNFTFFLSITAGVVVVWLAKLRAKMKKVKWNNPK